MLTPDQKRDFVQQLQEYGLNHRQGCKAMQISRSSKNYQRKQAADDDIIAVL